MTKVIGVTFNGNAQVYHYLIDANVEPGDYVVANDALASVTTVSSFDDYKPTHPNFAPEKLKTLRYFISRKAERIEAAKRKRVEEIKGILAKLQQRAKLRRDLEEMASDGGATGKQLLEELQALEEELGEL